MSTKSTDGHNSLTIAGSVADFVRVAGLALVKLASRGTAGVRTVPAVLRAFCREHVNHVLTFTFLLATDHSNNDSKIIGHVYVLAPFLPAMKLLDLTYTITLHYITNRGGSKRGQGATALQ